MMKLLPLILMLFSTLSYALAQVSITLPGDSTISPNTIRITGQVVSTDKKTAVIKVLGVIRSGSGIINVLSEGQTITVHLPDEANNLARNEKLEVDLREKVGVDASLSTYTLTRCRKLKR